MSDFYQNGAMKRLHRLNSARTIVHATRAACAALTKYSGSITLKLSLLVIALIAALGALPASSPKATNGKTPYDNYLVTNPPASTSDQLDLWIERLIEVESGGRSHLTVLDRNGRVSRGCLQFQDLTLIAYVRKHGFFPNAQDSELPNLAYDCRVAKNVARAMILDSPNNWRHWLNSVRKIGLPPGVDQKSSTGCKGGCVIPAAAARERNGPGGGAGYDKVMEAVPMPND
jgi:hypothetical protein